MEKLLLVGELIGYGAGHFEELSAQCGELVEAHTVGESLYSFDCHYRSGHKAEGDYLTAQEVAGAVVEGALFGETFFQRLGFCLGGRGGAIVLDYSGTGLRRDSDK